MSKVPVPPLPPPGGGLDLKFEALVRAHYGRLYGVAYSYLRAADAAEDAVQEALLKVWRQGNAVDLDNLLPYLFRAVRNQCITALRRRRRWRDVALDRTDLSLATDPTTLPSTGLEMTDLATAVHRAIDELPEQCRLVFLLSREQELTYNQIAQTLAISPKTVEAQMGKAFRLLRQRLAPFLTVAVVAASRLLSAGWGGG